MAGVVNVARVLAPLPAGVTARHAFFADTHSTGINPRFNEGALLTAHRTQLKKFRAHARRKDWKAIHNDHYDWYMFPIEDGSQPQYNVHAKDVAALQTNAAWVADYREGARLLLRAWGWDTDESHGGAMIDPPEPGMGWTGWDVRLAKVLRSLWLFQEDALLRSVQAYARVVKPTGGLAYGRHCLDEVFYMRLVRGCATSAGSCVGTDEEGNHSKDQLAPGETACPGADSDSAVRLPPPTHTAGPTRPCTRDDSSLARALALQEDEALAEALTLQEDTKLAVALRNTGRPPPREDSALARDLDKEYRHALAKKRSPIGTWFSDLLGSVLPHALTATDKKRGLKLLRERFDARGWAMVDVEGDGACQFRALSHQANGTEGRHTDVRRDVVERLRRHPPPFHDVQVYTSGVGRVDTPTLEEYLREMAKPATWGDQTTLQVHPSLLFLFIWCVLMVGPLLPQFYC